MIIDRLNLRRRRLATLALLLATAVAPAVERVGLTIERIDLDAQRHAEGISVTARPGGGGELHIRRLVLGEPVGTLEQVRLVCSRLRLSDAGIACEQGRLSAPQAYLAASPTPISFSYAFETGQLDLNLPKLALTFSAASGSPAAEALMLGLQLQANANKQGWDFDAQLRVPGGQAYVEPVFVDFSTHPARLSLSGSYRQAADEWRISEFRFTQQGVASVIGSVRLRGGDIAALQAELAQAQLPAAYSSYMQPFVIGTPLGSLDTAGQLAGRLAFDAQGLRRAELSGKQLSLQDQKQRLSLADGSLDIAWRRDMALDDMQISRLSWARASLYRIELGSAAIGWQMAGGAFRLTNPAVVPLLGGVFEVAQAQAKGLTSDAPKLSLDASLSGLQLQHLSSALGWPTLTGSLSGQVPRMRYQDSELIFEGGLQAQVFDGRVSVDKLRLADPLGARPRLRADIHADNLALETVTGAFSFGRISGRLDADIVGLRMLAWQPVAFDAWIRTPEDDRSRHRISRGAIDDLTSLGAGPSGLATRGFLSVFDDFAYQRIGLGCQLARGVCRMRGLGPAPDGGFYIMRGAWLPRVDIIGHNQLVSWPVFVEQLKSVTKGESLEIK